MTELEQKIHAIYRNFRVDMDAEKDGTGDDRKAVESLVWNDSLLLLFLGYAVGKGISMDEINILLPNREPSGRMKFVDMLDKGPIDAPDTPTKH